MAENKENEMKIQFEYEMTKSGQLSLWLMLMVFLMILPDFSQLLLINLMPDADSFVVCKISELFNAYWTPEQVRNISQPLGSGNRCKYYNYDYEELAQMGYPVALAYVKNTDIRPAIVKCDYYIVIDNKQKTLFDEFSLVCDNRNYMLILTCLCLVCYLFLGAIVLPFADIVGRKRLLLWGKNALLAGAISTCFALSIYMMFFGCILVCSGFALMKLPILAILVELTTATLRPLLFCLLFSGTAITRLLVPILVYETTMYWRYLQLLVAMGVLVIPVTTWYIPESPRWFMSKGKKGKAWSMLKTLRNSPDHNNLLLLFRNDDLNFKTVLKDHCKDLKRMLKTRTFINLIVVYVLVALLSLRNLQRNMVEFGDLQYSYELLSGLVEICSCLVPIPLLYICSTRITITLFTLLTCMFYFFAVLTKLGSSMNLALLLAINMFSSSALIVVTFHLIVSVPTSHRCTFLGFVILCLTSVAQMVVMRIVGFLSFFVLYIAMGVYALVVSSVMFITEKPKDILPETLEDLNLRHNN